MRSTISKKNSKKASHQRPKTAVSFRPSSIQQITRLGQIVNVFTKHGFRSFIEGSSILGLLSPEQRKVAEELGDTHGQPLQLDALEGTPTKNRKQKIATRLRMAFEELGPAFVKLGQMLSSREDIIPSEFTSEFRKLHQDVSPLPYSTMQDVLKAELGDDYSDSIPEIDSTPLAAGSIGQVHRATLANGDLVVIKIQRPHIADQISTDLHIMESIATLLEKSIRDLSSLRLSENVRELSRAVLGETDFVREAGFTSKVRENFKTDPTVVIPKVYWELTTPNILVLQFLDGDRVTSREDLMSKGHDPALLVENGLKMFLKMVFIDGLFHGDLHFGNLLALPDGKVGVVDFGLCMYLSPSTRENLAMMVMALAKEDFTSVVDHFVEIAEPGPQFDAGEFEATISQEIAPLIGLNLENLQTGPLFWKLARIGAEHGAPIPRQLLIYVKTLATFEAIGTTLHPTLDVMSVFETFGDQLSRELYSSDNLQRHLLKFSRDLTSLTKQSPRQIRHVLTKLEHGDFSINVRNPDIELTAKIIDRVISRLAIATIIASIIVGSSILVLAKVGEEYYHMSFFGIIGFAIAGILGLYIVYSMLNVSSIKPSTRK